MSDFQVRTQDDVWPDRALPTSFVGLIVTELVLIRPMVPALKFTEYSGLVSNFLRRDLCHPKDKIKIRSLNNFPDYDSGADKAFNSETAIKIVKP